MVKNVDSPFFSSAAVVIVTVKDGGIDGSRLLWRLWRDRTRTDTISFSLSRSPFCCPFQKRPGCEVQHHENSRSQRRKRDNDLGTRREDELCAAGLARVKEARAALS